MSKREYITLGIALAVGAMIFLSPKQSDAPVAAASPPVRKTADEDGFPTFPMSDFSARGCRAFADTEPEKALRPSLENLCMAQEQSEMKGLLATLRDIPEDVLKRCLFSVQEGPASSQRTSVIVNCLDIALNSMSVESLPQGTVTLYVGNLAHRYWNLADCQRRRQPGGICVTR